MEEKKKEALKLTLPSPLRKVVERPRWNDSSAAEEMPNLFEFLTPVWDNEGRLSWEGASLTVRVRNGQLWATIACPTAMRQLSKHVGSLTTLMTEMEVAVVESPAEDWEPTYELVKRSKKGVDKAKDDLMKMENRS